MYKNPPDIPFDGGVFKLFPYWCVVQLAAHNFRKPNYKGRKPKLETSKPSGVPLTCSGLQIKAEFELLYQKKISKCFILKEYFNRMSKN